MTISAAGPAPAIQGISHIALSVADLDAACDFWSGVMGFEITTHEPSLRFLVHRDARLGLGLTDHDVTVTGSFDERRPGLDHLAIAVPDAAAIHAWAARLDELGVEHSPVVETFAGLHLNLRAPDRVAVELMVLSVEAAAAFGLAAPEEAVAHTHANA